MNPSALLLLCRPGLESDAAAEITAAAAGLGVGGYCRASAGAGHLLFNTPAPGEAERLLQELPFETLIFVRAWFAVMAELSELPERDRAAPLAAAAAPLGQVSDLWLEYPDTNDGKALSVFCRKFAHPLRAELKRAGLRMGPANAPRLHVFFTDSRHAYLGYSLPENSARWPLGIPRLRTPAGAPSRSTLKLDEAINVFLSREEQDKRLQPGMRAVDLGAAPGGWTWQLVRRGLSVTAVDNGALAPQVLESGLVEHLRVDGFTYRPGRTVDWLVCDMVEQPHRIAGLVGEWIAERLCRAAIFNLKLPMKKRFQTVQECLAVVEKRAAQGGERYRLACKQLYHDREEVTVYWAR